MTTEPTLCDICYDEEKKIEAVDRCEECARNVCFEHTINLGANPIRTLCPYCASRVLPSPENEIREAIGEFVRRITRATGLKCIDVNIDKKQDPSDGNLIIYLWGMDIRFG